VFAFEGVGFDGRVKFLEEVCDCFFSGFVVVVFVVIFVVVGGVGVGDVVGVVGVVGVVVVVVVNGGGGYLGLGLFVVFVIVV